MTAIERTAYPRFKQILSAKDLAEVYTPTPAERLVAHRSTKGWVAEVGFLVLLKTYQRLGRFVRESSYSGPILRRKNATSGMDGKRKQASIRKVRRSLVDPFTEECQVAIESAIVERSQFHLDRCRIAGDRARKLEKRE